MPAALLLTTCGGGSLPPAEAAKAKKYTTTVKGKVVTPAKAADPTKGAVITTARVWASTDTTKKVAVGTDGSYSLEVVGHSGSFTITAEYTATDGKYKTSTAKTVTTKGPAIENHDITLKYGHTTEFTVRVGLQTATEGGLISSGVTVVITAEGNHEVGRGITGGTDVNAIIKVDHPHNRLHRSPAPCRSPKSSRVREAWHELRLAI